MLLLANRHGVHSVAVPLVFSEPRYSSSLTSKPVPAQTAQRIEALLRCVRSTLTETMADSDAALKEVCFLVPQSPKSLMADPNAVPPMLRHCRASFGNVFQC